VSSVGDGVREISIKSDQAFRILVWRLEGASLVLHVQDKVGESQIMAQAGTSFSVLERICRVIHRIRRIGSGGPAGTFTLADDLDALSGASM
jgi:phage-related protein